MRVKFLDCGRPTVAPVDSCHGVNRVTGFELVDTESPYHPVITPFTPPVIDLTEFPSCALNIYATVQENKCAPIKCVKLSLGDQVKAQKITPYALYGNTGRFIRSGKPALGAQTLKACTYTDDTCTQGRSGCLEVDVFVKDCVGTNPPTRTPTAPPTPSYPIHSTPPPTENPSAAPTVTPTPGPEYYPPSSPTPTMEPTTSDYPTQVPSEPPQSSDEPSVLPTSSPIPTSVPSNIPTTPPLTTIPPHPVPSPFPSEIPTTAPSIAPSDAPSLPPVDEPPTSPPTGAPSPTPSISPTAAPTSTPSTTPSGTPNGVPTKTPTIVPTPTPTISPTATPTSTPSTTPTGTPTGPTKIDPTKAPTMKPVSPAPNPSPITPTAPTFDEEDIKVACDFLKFFNINNCRLMTTFNDDPIGKTIPTEIGLLTQLSALRFIGNAIDRHHSIDIGKFGATHFSGFEY